jgi:hypothetical protein
MPLSDIASLATVISGVAVLASLVYLAQQTRQNTKHARALLHQARSEQAIHLTMLNATDLQMADLWLQGASGNVEMDRAKTFAYMNMAIAQLGYAENVFWQNREGLIDDQRNEATTTWLRFMLSHVGFRSVWLNARGSYGEDFQAFVDRIMNEVRSSVPVTDPVDQWRALVAGEKDRGA